MIEKLKEFVDRQIDNQDPQEYFPFTSQEAKEILFAQKLHEYLRSENE